jgi:hypothetical protein
MAFRHHETSLTRHHQSRILRRQTAEFELSGPVAYLKYHLNDFIQVVLFDAQVEENDFVLPFYTLKNHFIDFTKIVF